MSNRLILFLEVPMLAKWRGAFTLGSYIDQVEENEVAGSDPHCLAFLERIKRSFVLEHLCI